LLAPVPIVEAGKGRSLKTGGDSGLRPMTGALLGVQNPAYRLAVFLFLKSNNLLDEGPYK